MMEWRLVLSCPALSVVDSWHSCEYHVVLIELIFFAFCFHDYYTFDCGFGITPEVTAIVVRVI